MRLLHVPTVVLALICAAQAHGATISTATCGVSLPEGEIVVTSMSECTLGEPSANDPAYAHASLGYTLNPGELSIFAEVRTSVYVLPDADFFGEWATTELTLTLTSLGPTRPGLLDLACNQIRNNGFATVAYSQASIGSLSGYDCEGLRGTFPFTLGQPFDAFLFTYGEGGLGRDGGDFSDVSTNLSIQLRELDGTPAALSIFPIPAAIPEPSTFLLVFSALSLLAWSRRPAK